MWRIKVTDSLGNKNYIYRTESGDVRAVTASGVPYCLGDAGSFTNETEARFALIDAATPADALTIAKSFARFPKGAKFPNGDTYELFESRRAYEVAKTPAEEAHERLTPASPTSSTANFKIYNAIAEALRHAREGSSPTSDYREGVDEASEQIADALATVADSDFDVKTFFRAVRGKAKFGVA
jgi:soluble cytochrome b562